VTQQPLVIKDLAKHFGDFVAVDGITFDVNRGETFGVLGPNGAGKSSTLKMIGTVSSRTSGHLSVFGLDPDRYGKTIRTRLGVVPQEDIFDEDLTAVENIVVFARYFGISRKVARERAAQMLEFMQLTEKADEKIRALSGGMKRRLTIARAMVSNPEMILLDEPTTGLDPQARHLLWDRLRKLKEQGVTLVLTTHYMDEAEQLSDRLIIMDNGRIADGGSPAELIERHVTREVLELRIPDGGEVAGLEPIAESNGWRVDTLPDRHLVFADSGDAALSLLRDGGVQPHGTYVRRSTLEDVFLALTGRTLEE